MMVFELRASTFGRPSSLAVKILNTDTEINTLNFNPHD